MYGTPAVTIQYAYDGAQIVAEYDANDTLLRKFVYGPGIDEPICLIDVADAHTRYFYHCDGLGSVVALSDVNNVLVERYAYDVFGRPTIRDANGAEIAASAFANPYLFTARAYDAETALYYYRARYYDYFTGRFLQADPLGHGDGLNLYTYCSNNPINWMDPYGLLKWGQLFKGIGQVVGGAVAVGTCGFTATLNPLFGLGQAVGGITSFSFGIGNIVGAFAQDVPTLPSTVPGTVGMAFGGERGAAIGDLMTAIAMGDQTATVIRTLGIAVDVGLEELEQYVDQNVYPPNEDEGVPSGKECE